MGIPVRVLRVDVHSIARDTFVRPNSRHERPGNVQGSSCVVIFDGRTHTSNHVPKDSVAIFS
eukprot:scaffold215766_cov31-Tisochrysis_lutea.AAC.2